MIITDEAIEAVAELYAEAEDTGSLDTAKKALEAAALHVKWKGRIIDSTEDLTALPEGSVILGGGMVPRIRAHGDLWIGDGIDVDSDHIITWAKTATVLYEPS